MNERVFPARSQAAPSPGPVTRSRIRGGRAAPPESGSPGGRPAALARPGSWASASVAAFLPPVAIALVIAIAYLPGLSAPFYMDDELQILHRPEMRPGGGSPWWSVSEILARHGMRDRALAFVSFYWNRALAGDDPFAFRIVNLALHLGSFLLLYGLLRGLARGGDRPGGRDGGVLPLLPLGAAALWAASPANVQAVTYVVQRMTGAMTFFCLASVCSFLAACRAEGPRRRIMLLVLAGVLMVVSIGFKQNGVLVPYFWLLAWWFLGANDPAPRGPWRSGSPRRWAGAVLLAWTALLCAEWARVAIASPSPEGLSRTGHWMTAARVVAHLTGLFFFPAASRLHLNYEIQPSSGLFSPLSTFGGILFVAAWAVSIALLRKRDRWISFGLAWALVGILPESLLPNLDLAFEHRLYLPSIGLSVAGCRILYLLTTVPFRKGGLDRIRAWAFPAALVMVVAVWSAWTWERNGVWADPARFIRHEWTMSPGHPRTMGGMMHYMLGQRRYREAIALGETALRVRHNPVDEAALRNNLALAYGGAGDWGSAARLLENSINADGAAVFHLYNLGVAYYESGKLELAARRFGQVLSGDPRHPDANYYLGKVRRDQGNPAEAVPLFERALSGRPSDGEVLRDLLDACIAAEEWRRASAALERYGPGHRAEDALSIEIQSRSGLVHLRTGRLDMAEAAYRGYLRHAPRDAVARYNLACVLSRKGDVRESLTLLEELLSGGFRERVLLSDPDLALVRQTPEFNRLVAKFGIGAGEK